ncbi:MAG: chromosome segregation ATPase [Kiritimatiellia bacterium]|jgi:chromosome segregation ATPase
MSTTDFFDDDLVKPRTNGYAAPEVASVRVEEAPSGSRQPAQSDNNLTRMARHRDQLEGQVATAMTEIERLRMRQDDLEIEKRQLEELRKKQDGYVRAKREMIQRLHQSLIALEKEEIKASQLTELYSNTRRSFRSMVEEIETVDEATWSEDDVQDELHKAQDLIDNIRVECSKALVKLDTFSNAGQARFGEGHTNTDAEQVATNGFAYWLKVGLAISLPFALVLGGVSALLYFAITTWFA